MTDDGPAGRDAVRRAYDDSAPEYDDRFRDLQRPKFRQVLGPGLERLAGWLERGPVLDLGCGTGLLGELARECGHDPSRIVGVDFSRPMLERARERCGALVQADMEQLPFRSRTFAAVVAFTVVGLLSDPASDARTLAEAARLVAPAGALAVAVPGYAAERLRARLAELGTVRGDGVPCGPDVGYVCIVGG